MKLTEKLVGLEGGSKSNHKRIEHELLAADISKSLDSNITVKIENLERENEKLKSNEYF